MRKWLQALVDQYLPIIAQLEDTPTGRATAQEQAEWMKQQWSAHGMAFLNQQRNLMTEVRQAIKRQLGQDHFALKSMDFSSEEWTQMNYAIAERAAAQNQQQVILDPRTVNAIVTRATNLLLSREWADVAAGLAVLTGRRSTEIIKTAEFEPKSAYSLMFTGALKRRGEDITLKFEIPTLCQAQYVITALGRLRKFVPTQELDHEQVNDRFSTPVTRACDRHFNDLVPPIAGRDNLYTHLFRKIYATIATYFYCPQQVDEAEFRAEIQGHFAGHSHLSQAARRQIASDRHYRSYLIQEPDGAMRKGIKLAQPNVEVIQVFQPTTTTDELTRPEPETASAAPTKRKISNLRVFQAERDRWLLILDQMAPEVTQAEKMSTLLEWIEGKLLQQELGEALEQQGMDPEPEPELPAAEVAVATTPAITLTEATVTAASSPAMEQAWEKIGGLVEVLTRLTDRLDAQAHVETRPAQPATSNRSDSKMVDHSTAMETDSVAQRTNSVAQEGKSRPGRSSTTGEAKVNDAIDQIIQYNSKPKVLREQMWAISLSILKRATKASQAVINRVLEQRSEEIEQHHQLHGLGKTHNNLHRRKGTDITDVVQV